MPSEEEIVERTSTYEPTGEMAGGSPSFPEQARQQMGEAGHGAREAAGGLAHQARSQVKSRLSDQKERAAEGLGGVASALRQTGDQLKQQETPVPIGDYADRAAEMVEQIAGYLKTKDIDQIVGQAENLARRRPAVFLGTAFVLGFMATRFLKSTPTGMRGNGGRGMERQFPEQARFDAPYYRDRETIREAAKHEQEGYPLKSAYERAEELQSTREWTGGGHTDFASGDMGEEESPSDFAQTSSLRSSDV